MGRVWQRWLGQERWRSAIVLGFFGRVGLLNGKLYRVELVEIGEEYPG